MAAKPLDENQRETLSRIRRQLSEEFRRAGWGSKKKALENIGVSRNQLDMAFTSGYLKIGLLLQILDELGVSPEDFFFDTFDLQRHQPRSIEAVDEGLLQLQEILRNRGRLGDERVSGKPEEA